MPRPTEEAIEKFDLAQRHILAAGLQMSRDPSEAGKRLADEEIARGLWDMAVGLGKLSVGLRATYILLEEVKAAVTQKK